MLKAKLVFAVNLVAISIAILFEIALIIVPVKSLVNKQFDLADVTMFLIGVCGAIVVTTKWLPWATSNLRDNLEIKRIVGIHPSEIDEWKWKMLAGRIAQKTLWDTAFHLQLVARDELEILSSPSPDSSGALKCHKEIKGYEKRFWAKYWMFRKFGLDFTAGHWSNWGEDTSVKSVKETS